jgi:tRNA A-37 threonylcarbamoyl transferase component Bud32
MYIATLNGTDQEVVVKFTARYNKEAHSLLADAGFAPKLHFCECVVGNVYMVVMDRIEGKSIWQLRQEKIDTPAIVQEQVERAVAVLHGAGIVFGDLRDANIMYGQSGGSAEGSVFLVDFDWAGKAGEGRYPATLNTDNCWEESVSAYGVMQKAHDLWQLDHLKDA